MTSFLYGAWFDTFYLFLQQEEKNKDPQLKEERKKRFLILLDETVKQLTIEIAIEEFKSYQRIKNEPKTHRSANKKFPTEMDNARF